MQNTINKYYGHSVKLIAAVVIAAAASAIFLFVLPVLAPFFTGAVIALINEPMTSALEKARMPRKAASLISLIFTSCVVIAIVAFIGMKLYAELMNLQSGIAGMIGGFSDDLGGRLDDFAVFYQSLPERITLTIEQSVLSIAPAIQGILSTAIMYVMNTLFSLPKIIFFIVVTFLSAFVISMDKKRYISFMSDQLPEWWTSRLRLFKSESLRNLGRYLMAVLILMTVTFCVGAVGFLIIKPEYTLVMAAVLALCEGIPVIGTGFVLIPWALISLAGGDLGFAVKLLALYLVGLVIRQTIEPKVVGEKLGIPPLANVIGMYVGIRLMGLFGLIFGPLLIIVVKALYTSGILDYWFGRWRGGV
ncbi:MAG: sporulation integral membrane protein YtvI [Oscillospiraceae bacterium]|nr:sporulation integral membrane protein YtvI [Oscillospiraceae bacterium]